MVRVALLAALGACGQAPVKLPDSHLLLEAARSEEPIPEPVQLAPLLPPPKPAPRPETYTVVVHNVRVQDLLFALARDARFNVDIHPGVGGSVTLNAIDQTLPQLLGRIARQVDMRYEMEGETLTVMRDTPFLRIYRVDYVNLSRDARSVANLATQVSGVSGSGTSGGSAGMAQNNSTAIVSTLSANRFWETLVANVRDLLRETDKTVLLGAAPAPPAAAVPRAQPQAPPPPGVEFREAASVIANAEAGVLSIRATSRQHERVQEFLDLVLANAKRQVLIEATIAEVQLNNQYQRGIDWSRLRTGGAGFQVQQSSAATPAGVSTGAFVFGYATRGLNFTAAMRLLESFGDVRVLSSPKISVLNNQTAVLKVVDNLVYFTVQASTTTAANSPAVTTFTTTVNSVPVGFIMSVVPQISDSATVLLNLRPTISRKLADIPDPNPSLANPCGVGVPNCATPAISSLIPVIQTRELESVLRVQSGQIAMLGGLMQDAVSSVEDTVPGLRQVPGLGALLAQRRDVNQKTELVIFLRPTVIRDASVEGDYRQFRNLLPATDYLSRPNPARADPVGR
ncbi:MAG: type II and III secretion system protein [Betaproteobacteria bacterium]|nr:MAG: type II and III secretion system protein [Betaproteobacteria bacterium]